MQPKFYILDFINRSMVQDLKLVPDFLDRHGNKSCLYQAINLTKEIGANGGFTGNLERDTWMIGEMIRIITSDNKEGNSDFYDCYLVVSGRWPTLGFILEAIETYVAQNNVPERMMELLNTIWMPVVVPETATARDKTGRLNVRARTFVIA